MMRRVLELCLSLVLVFALILPSAGCIKLGKSPSPSDNQTVPSPSPSANQTMPSPQPPAPAPPTPPADQSGLGVLQPSPAGPVAVANWIGTWQCGSTKIYINQSGSKVTGWIDYNNYKLDGTATGNTLNGTWSSPPLSGGIQLIMLADGKSFAGTYGAGSAISGSGVYSCTRISSAAPAGAPSPPSLPAPAANWTGTWQCGQYKMYLTQSGSQVTGWYDNQNGDIDGYASGSTLVGTWFDSQAGSRDIQLNMSANGDSFTGLYRTGAAGNWINYWSCTKISSAIPPAKPATLGPPPTVPTANWSGKWLCGQWGTLTISQSGDVVTGSYTYDNGKLKGNVGGDKLYGTWSEEPSYAIPNDAGDVEFTMAPDGNSFTGRWRYGFTGEWKTWNGQRDLSNQLPPGQN